MSSRPRSVLWLLLVLGALVTAALVADTLVDWVPWPSLFKRQLAVTMLLFIVLTLGGGVLAAWWVGPGAGDSARAPEHRLGPGGRAGLWSGPAGMGAAVGRRCDRRCVSPVPTSSVCQSVRLSCGYLCYTHVAGRLRVYFCGEDRLGAGLGWSAYAGQGGHGARRMHLRPVRCGGSSAPQRTGTGGDRGSCIRAVDLGRHPELDTDPLFFCVQPLAPTGEHTVGADCFTGVTPGRLLRDDPAARAHRLSLVAAGPAGRSAAAGSGSPGRRAAAALVQSLVLKRNAVHHPRAVYGDPHSGPDRGRCSWESPGRGVDRKAKLASSRRAGSHGGHECDRECDVQPAALVPGPIRTKTVLGCEPASCCGRDRGPHPFRRFRVRRQSRWGGRGPTKRDPPLPGRSGPGRPRHRGCQRVRLCRCVSRS